MRKTFSLVLLALCFAGFSLAQNTPDNQPSNQGIKSDVKQAGKSSARAAKKTGHKAKATSKTVVHKGARKTRQGSEKVEDKTQAPPQ